jgi:hypothetical protein
MPKRGPWNGARISCFHRPAIKRVPAFKALPIIDFQFLFQGIVQALHLNIFGFKDFH